ncbi:MAG: hypothetical protein ACJ76Y_12365 [Thermoanaerobaculia bacterium]|jgi:hypothetical protein
MKAYEIGLAILCVWRITHLLQAEDGPWDLVVRLRRVAGGGFAGELLDCFYCLSLWISAPFAWGSGETWRERLLLWPALSAVAIFLERLTAPPTGSPPVSFVADEIEDKKEAPPCSAAARNGLGGSIPMPREAMRLSAISSGTRETRP